MRKALVTGASGTLGRAVVSALVADGFAVTGTGRRPVVLDGATYVAGDLRDPELRASLVPEDAPLVFVHCAGHRFGYARMHAFAPEDLDGQIPNVSFSRSSSDLGSRLSLVLFA